MWNKSQVYKYNGLIRLLVMLGPAGGGVGGYLSIHVTLQIEVADPNLQIGGGGGSHPDHEMGGVSEKNFCWSFGPQFVLKIRWGGGPPKPHPWIRP